MTEKKKPKTVSHTNFEVVRRLPDDADTLTAMCNALKADFAGRGLVESEESKQHRNKLRKRSNLNVRVITPDIQKLLVETAESLGLTTTQIITLLVFLHKSNPSWTARKPNKLPRRLTVICKPHSKNNNINQI